MSRYTVCFSVAEVYVNVEAEGEDEARELAEEKLSEMEVGLCHHCAQRIEQCDPVLVAVNKDPDLRRGA